MIDTMFDALADPRRRRLLVDLLEHNPQQVEKPPGSPRERDAAEREWIETHHVHLPKLADYGFVEWDREEDTVTKGPKFDEIRPALELLDDNRDVLPAEWT